MSDKEYKPFARIHLNQPYDMKTLDDGTNCISQEIRHMVQMVQTRMDDDVIRSICRIARAEGVTDVTIIDKEFVLSMLRKSIPTKPVRRVEDGIKVYRTHNACRICDAMLPEVSRCNYCPSCGQALDWD